MNFSMRIDKKDTLNLKELARHLDCFTEEEVASLGGYSSGSIDSLRRRGALPNHIRFGNNRFYPINAVREFFKGRMNERVLSVEDRL